MAQRLARLENLSQGVWHNSEAASTCSEGRGPNAAIMREERKAQHYSLSVTQSTLKHTEH